MITKRSILIAAVTLLCTAGCRGSEPGYWDFYKPDITEEENPGGEGPEEPEDPDPDPDQFSIYTISFNIRYVNDSDTGTKAWSYRRPAVKAMVEDRKPDVMGVQEARLSQRKEMDLDLEEDYRSVAVGRNDGTENDPTGEFMAIYYRLETVSMDEWGTFWLSETPDTPSKGWDANNYRTATWAVLTHLESGNKFFLINTHLDHLGTVARANSMILIEDKMEELNPAGYPMILMADFNTSIDDSIFESVKTFMSDARTEAPITDSKNSFNDFGTGALKIDHIFYSRFKALSFETIDQRYEDVPYISDHYPVAAALEFE